ncbi:MAG: tRNA dihydrouridine(20/20a) synthase DusA [Duodenibacillus sp.]|nr:tRNA dihydrouridine(20/20a) synthase DusA [Duodenibacillus sp.]
MNASPWRFCVAPMLDWTDSHCRVFHRALSRHARLYTEMITAPALIHGDRARLLRREDCEHPVACQVGGSDPAELAQAARWIREAGFDEVNLNCGCPSERVQRGSFGACLMLEPALVADCFKAMADAAGIPVTVKHRTGVDGEDGYGFVRDFVGTLYEAGCRVFIVHTRAAWLKGLSPKENREVPPLRRAYAAMLKRDFPEATVCVNGGLATLEQAEAAMAGVDGCMIGRAAYQNPWLLSDVDARLFGDDHDVPTRADVIDAMTAYLQTAVARSPLALRGTARHMLGLLNGLAGAKAWRRTLSDPAAYAAFGTELLHEAYARAGWREAAVGCDRLDDDEY